MKRTLQCLKIELVRLRMKTVAPNKHNKINCAQIKAVANYVDQAKYDACIDNNTLRLSNLKCVVHK